MPASPAGRRAAAPGDMLGGAAAGRRSPDRTMKLSVIVPTHNRVEVLQRTLEALERQTLGRDEFEVLVVDDGSAEAHRQVLRRLLPPYSYRLIEKPQGGLASARNCATARNISGTGAIGSLNPSMPTRDTTA